MGVYAMAHALHAINGTWYYVTSFANNYKEFKLNYGHNVSGHIGYQAICIKIMQ